MAQQMRMILTDDLDGSDAVETVTFGLDGLQYEIDLNARHADLLRGALSPFVTHGRRVSLQTAPSPAQTPSRRVGGSRKRVTTMEEIEAIKRDRS